MKKIYTTLLITVSIFLLHGCTNIDDKYYSETTPENYFNSQDAVLGRLARPYSHLQWTYTGYIHHLNQTTTDEMSITTKGRHWSGNGAFLQQHRHQWSAETTSYGIENTWTGLSQGIGYVIDAKDDIAQYVDYDALLFPQGTRENHLAQLDAMAAVLYKRLLQNFGGVPIYTSKEDDAKPRATAQETFDHVESLLLNAIPHLRKKEQGDIEDVNITRGTAAMMLMRLYFNAEATIGVPMYTEAAQIAEDMIAGEYGYYQLEDTWNEVFGLDNMHSSELVWGVYSKTAIREQRFPFSDYYHYTSYQYFGADGGSNNGVHLQPSLDPEGNPYTSKLGRPFAKFHDDDLRKKPYKYLGNKQSEGMFLVGEQINPNNPTQISLGTEEYRDQPLVFVDQVARFSEYYNGNVPSLSELRSSIVDGEENSGVRLIKRPRPFAAEKSIEWDSYPVIYRFAEVYYTLAECEYRAGNSERAAQLINEVRQRNFEGGIDPDPVTPANLDEYRLLDEWMVEFIGEARRRMDLIRWNKFVTEDWWDHEATNDPKYNLFPIPSSAIAGNPLLEQNPGY